MYVNSILNTLPVYFQMFTYRSFFNLNKVLDLKCLCRAQLLKAGCHCNQYRSCMNSCWNNYSKHYSRLKIASPLSSSIFNFGSNRSHNSVKQWNKHYAFSKSYNNLRNATSFSNCNFLRHFSSAETNFHDDKVNNNTDVIESDSIVSVSDAEVTFSSLGTDIGVGKSGEELVEPSFNSLGLGGWTPSGLVQNGMEYLHMTCDLPWWACVVCGTVIIRTAVLPLVIRYQKGVVVMSNALPQLQLLQMKMNIARESGNVIEAARYGNELVKLVKEKKINPLKSAVIPLIQMPFFLSFFFGLRGMSDLPVESLRSGGLWWFSDLTIGDPFYILPLATCLTMFITIELGLETGISPNQTHMKTIKYLMRAMPLITFPIIINFPGIICVYWLSTNVYSLVQSSVLRIPQVRNFCGFEPAINNAESFNLIEKLQRSVKNEGFKEGFKESLTNMKISQEVMERQALDVEEKLKKMKGVDKKHQEKL